MAQQIGYPTRSTATFRDMVRAMQSVQTVSRFELAIRNAE